MKYIQFGFNTKLENHISNTSVFFLHRVYASLIMEYSNILYLLGNYGEVRREWILTVYHINKM